MDRTILQIRFLSPSDGEISTIRFISSLPPVSTNNDTVFKKFSVASRQISSSQIFHNTPTCLVFCDCLFKKITLKEVICLT